MDKRDWTPVRKGDIYCSPACGAKCTHEAYTTAVESAKKLKERCEKEIGGEWDINVHENLGWHWSVYHKKTNLNISYGGYLAQSDYFSIGLCSGTPSQISLHPQTFKSPKEAWDKQIEVIEKEAKRWNDILVGVN